MARILLAILMVGSLLAGCGEGDAGKPGKKKYLIGVVAKSSTNPVFQAAHAGARDAAKQLAVRYGAEIELKILTPERENAQKQAEAVEALTRMGAHGIAISCSEAGTVTPAINAAAEKGVVVVCFDSDAPQSKRLCYYGTDDADCGRQVMEALAKAMDEKGTVAILAGNQSAPNLQARARAVTEVLSKYPNIKALPAGPVYHEETPEKAAEKLQDVQRNNPQITGWALIGGWPLFTKDALPWKPGAVKVVSVDALPAQLPYVKNGYVEVLLAQDCYGWGKKSMELLLEKIVNNQAPATPKVIDPLTKVTKDNADAYGKNWDNWLK